MWAAMIVEGWEAIYSKVHTFQTATSLFSSSNQSDFPQMLANIDSFVWPLGKYQYNKRNI